MTALVWSVKSAITPQKEIVRHEMIPPGTMLRLIDSNSLRSISTMGTRLDCRASSPRLTYRWMQICTGRVYSKRMSWSSSRVLCRISCSQLMEWLVLHRLLLMIAVEQFISSVRSWQLYSPLQTNAYGKHCTISQRNRSAAQTIELSRGGKQKKGKSRFHRDNIGED